MCPKRLRSPPKSDACSTTYSSSVIEDRSSRFIALYSPDTSVKILQELPLFKGATHRIAAWRKPSTQQTLGSKQLYDSGHDDDGEKNGGRTLEAIMTSLNVEGVVVVGRWYGGIMLGPVRFDHIKNCAREAIARSRYDDKDDGHGIKQVKIIEGSVKKKKLLQLLPERDHAISVLRELLAEKQKLNSPRKVSPAKVPDYTALSLSTLENLERARDATIGWVLQQIEKAEAAEEQSSAALNPDPQAPHKNPGHEENSGGVKTQEPAEPNNSPQQVTR
ncbi:MAG: hypothetical protein Q9181_006765 [Wetmoreana brouardii]